MSASIYRKTALDRMASPERLDAPLALVGRPMWLMLAAFAALIATALVWAIVTEAPVKVAGRGVLIDRTGLSEIVAGEEGRIDRVLVSPGDHVAAGQPVATVSRTELAREIAEARARLADAQARYARLSGFYGAQDRQRGGADAQRLAGIAESRRALADRERYLGQKVAQMERLVERGFILRERLVQAQIELADVRERMSTLAEAQAQVRIGATERDGQAGLALLDERRTIEEQQRVLQRLTARLTDQRVIRARAAGRIAEIKVNAGDVIAPGTALATVVPAGDDAALVAILYVPADEGKRIEPGMTAEIAPTAVKRAVYGHIRGEVASVAPLAATAEGMRRLLRNDQLIAELVANGAPIEVRVTLKRDPATASGFVWSSSKGPPSRIGAGSLVEGRVVVDRTPVIGWMIPRAGS